LHFIVKSVAAQSPPAPLFYLLHCRPSRSASALHATLGFDPPALVT
jgi:hypothetical protein